MRVALLWLLLVGLALGQAPSDEKGATRAPGVEAGNLQRIQLRRQVGNKPSPRGLSAELVNSSEIEAPDPMLAAVPVGYRLAPGDQLELTMVSGTTETLQRTIQPDGFLTVGPARVQLTGFTMAQATTRIRRELGRYFRNFMVNVSLRRVRRFPIRVVGEVVNPGIYEASGVSGAAELVLDAGGLTKIGSMRRVQMLNSESNRPFRVLDFLKWQSLGQEDQNPFVSAQQTIVVPAIGREVQLSGEVLQPGIYEILENETLASLLRVAGGVTSVADKRQVQVARLLPSGKRQDLRFNLEDPASEGWSFRLEDGDQVSFYDRSLAQGRLIVIGEVRGKDFFPETVNQVSGLKEVQRRGVYSLSEGETARQVVLALGGLTAKADLEHAWIERLGPDKELVKIPLNLRQLITQQEAPPPGQMLASDVQLHDGDTLVVPSLPDTVFLAGHFYKPGPLPYNPAYGLREYIAQAGGTTEKAHTKHARLIRHVPDGPPIVWEFNLLDVMEEGYQPVSDVRPGDVIYVPLFKPFYTDLLQFLPSLLLIPSIYR